MPYNISWDYSGQQEVDLNLSLQKQMTIILGPTTIFFLRLNYRIKLMAVHWDQATTLIEWFNLLSVYTIILHLLIYALTEIYSSALQVQAYVGST